MITCETPQIPFKVSKKHIFKENEWICTYFFNAPQVMETFEQWDELLEDFQKEILFDATHLEIAHLIGQMSYCTRKKVGAVLVKDGQIISTGFNGTLPNLSNKCEDSSNQTLETVIHAEMNCLAKLAKKESSNSDASVMYITLSPCIDCLKLSIACGVKKFIFNKLHSSFYKLELIPQMNLQGVIYSPNALNLIKL
jgi:dCMP deaminase